MTHGSQRTPQHPRVLTKTPTQTPAKVPTETPTKTPLKPPPPSKTPCKMFPHPRKSAKWPNLLKKSVSAFLRGVLVTKWFCCRLCRIVVDVLCGAALACPCYMSVISISRAMCSGGFVRVQLDWRQRGFSIRCLCVQAGVRGRHCRQTCK